MSAHQPFVGTVDVIADGTISLFLNGLVNGIPFCASFPVSKEVARMMVDDLRRQANVQRALGAQEVTFKYCGTFLAFIFAMRTDDADSLASALAAVVSVPPSTDLKFSGTFH